LQGKSRAEHLLQISPVSNMVLATNGASGLAVIVKGRAAEENRIMETIKMTQETEGWNVTVLDEEKLQGETASLEKVVLVDVEEVEEILGKVQKLLKNRGVVFVGGAGQESDLKLAGFVNVVRDEKGWIQGSKPSYEVGTRMKLGKLGKKEAVKQAWVAAAKEDEGERVEEDGLLDDEDLKLGMVEDCEPVAGVKRKACKNCSCGRAEEEEEEKLVAVEGVVKNKMPKSSCGNVRILRV
jgi:hypothetical protein